jgi:hypothetical protein
MFVRPGPSPDDGTKPLTVREPNGRLLPAAGAEVPPTQFWQRRLRDGDVVAATEAAP